MYYFTLKDSCYYYEENSTALIGSVATYSFFAGVETCYLARLETL